MRVFSFILVECSNRVGLCTCAIVCELDPPNTTQLELPCIHIHKYTYIHTYKYARIATGRQTLSASFAQMALSCSATFASSSVRPSNKIAKCQSQRSKVKGQRSHTGKPVTSRTQDPNHESCSMSHQKKKGDPVPGSAILV